jgi:hypothetical protein
MGLTEDLLEETGQLMSAFCECADRIEWTARAEVGPNAQVPCCFCLTNAIWERRSGRECRPGRRWVVSGENSYWLCERCALRHRARVRHERRRNRLYWRRNFRSMRRWERQERRAH